MTIAELMAAVVAALTRAFETSKWAVWPNPPETTAVPAIWPEFSSSLTGSSRTSTGVVVVQFVAVIAPQTGGAQWDAIADAHDRLDTLTAADIGGGGSISARTAQMGAVVLGGVDHTALLYAIDIARGLPC